MPVREKCSHCSFSSPLAVVDVCVSVCVSVHVCICAGVCARMCVCGSACVCEYVFVEDEVEFKLCKCMCVGGATVNAVCACPTNMWAWTLRKNFYLISPT